MCRVTLSWSYGFFCLCYFFLFCFGFFFNTIWGARNLHFLLVPALFPPFCSGRCWFLPHFPHLRGVSIWPCDLSIQITGAFPAPPLRTIALQPLFHYFKMCILSAVTSHFTTETVAWAVVFHLSSSLVNTSTFYSNTSSNPSSCEKGPGRPGLDCCCAQPFLRQHLVVVSVRWAAVKE